jgi:hypothetical protein
MTDLERAEAVVAGFFADNPDLVADAEAFGTDGPHLLIPPRLLERFRQWARQTLGAEPPIREGAARAGRWWPPSCRRRRGAGSASGWWRWTARTT